MQGGRAQGAVLREPLIERAEPPRRRTRLGALCPALIQQSDAHLCTSDRPTEGFLHPLATWPWGGTCLQHAACQTHLTTASDRSEGR